MQKVIIRIFEGGVPQRVQDRFSASEVAVIQNEVDKLLELPIWNTYTYYYVTEFIRLEEDKDPYILCVDLSGQPRTFPGCFTMKFLDRDFPIQSESIVVRFESA